MPSTRIDRDEYEASISELSGRHEVRDGDTVIITGNHKYHGRVTAAARGRGVHD